MKGIKKFWIALLILLPVSAGALAPFFTKFLAGGAAIAGFSIYRSNAPVNMQDALSFFSACWSCQTFTDVMSTMSVLIPRAYTALGGVVFPVVVALVGVWIAWKLLSGFLNAKMENAWTLTGNLGSMFVKLGFVGALLITPLPRMMTDVAIEPIFNIGLSVSRALNDNQNFSECVVASAIVDQNSDSVAAAKNGAFSPRLQHNMACEIATVHQMTGLGMTVGWTMLNMAFDEDYMHHIMWGVPIFPNVPILVIGLILLALFFTAMLPVPLYFLEIFIKLSMDFVMMPLMLMAWLFKGWVLPENGKNIRGIIDDFIQGALGIAMVGVFVGLANNFIDGAFGTWNSASTLKQAIESNDSNLLMDGLMLNNDSLMTIMLMGLFIALFMVSIPNLIKLLFSQVKIPENFAETAKKDADIVWKGVKNLYKSIKK